MNTGFPDPAVATVLTACGIETRYRQDSQMLILKLQQYLPLAVLKPVETSTSGTVILVATVLTACGIETYKIYQGLLMIISCNSTYRLRY